MTNRHRELPMRFVILSVVLASSLTACLKRDRLWCDETHPCIDEEHPFCDLEAQYPESDNIRHTCIAAPFDANLPDANLPDAGPVCAANTKGCAANAYTECDAQGQYIEHFDCGVLGCNAAGDACLDIAPTNGLGLALDFTSNPATPENGEAWDFSDGLLTIDTTMGTAAFKGTSVNLPSRLTAQASGLPQIRVFMVGSIKLKDLAATGENSLAFVSNGDITVTGTVDVSANNPATTGGGPGPGAITTISACTGASTSDFGAGGGGRARTGLVGKTPTGTGTPGGSTYATTSLGSPLVGGCAGGSVVPPSTSKAAGGGGGGAVQFTSRTRIALAATAAVNVGGGGGGAGGTYTSGGNLFYYSAAGGGSAGLIVLEAPSVTFAAGVVLAAKGGGGGGFAAVGATGSADVGTTGAKGGVSATCQGADGSDGLTATWNDASQTLSTSSGLSAGACGTFTYGGGGGAPGFLVIRNNNSGIVTLNGAAVRAWYPTNANIATRNRTAL